MKKKFYIKERDNPQSKDPYYVAEGQLTKAGAKRKLDTIYGYNTMHSFDTEEEYKKEIERLKAEGFRVM